MSHDLRWSAAVDPWRRVVSSRASRNNCERRKAVVYHGPAEYHQQCGPPNHNGPTLTLSEGLARIPVSNIRGYPRSVRPPALRETSEYSGAGCGIHSVE
jgi:hypothetical protein